MPADRIDKMKFYLTTPVTDERPVYIAGNFNKWNPKSNEYQMDLLPDGKYFIDISNEKLPQQIEYKYTKGGWANVELDEEGNITPNRKIPKSKKKVEDHVEKWRMNWGPFKKEYQPIVELIDEKFYIPQLDRTRKVWALLPYNYRKSDAHYPVLYLQDAQNLFRDGSEYGNWEIDNKLALLSEYGRGDVIIIAIEHGNEERINEYIFENPKLTEDAEGKKYIRFITDTLKPYVDQKYRTKKEREYTGIGGSSLGALISIYAGFLYPEVYSKLMLFSPSLWVEPENNFPMVSFQHAFKTKVYLYAGGKESKEMVNRIEKFSTEMVRWEDQGLFDFEVRVVINPDGEHQEYYWSQEFPKAIEWLYFDSAEDPVDLIKKSKHRK